MKLVPVRRWIGCVLSICLAVLCSGLTNRAAALQTAATTVYLVRHAEKETTPPDNPPLTEAGKARAEELARVLGQAKIQTIISSQYARTQQTAEPTAKRFGVPITTLQLRMDMAKPREISLASIKEIVDKIYAQAGGDVLVVGHSNTIPEVIKMLGIANPPVINEKEFDDLFILTVMGKGQARVAHVKYGARL